MPNNRLLKLENWLSDCFETKDIELTPMSGDAGFRRYYRLMMTDKTFIVVDAPNDKSNNIGFVAIQQAFINKGLIVPEVFFHQPSTGFFCLSDLGSVEFSDQVIALLSQSRDDEHQRLIEHYYKAINQLPAIQTSHVDDNYLLPQYDNELLTTELGIFPEWLIGQHLSLTLTTQENEQLSECFKTLKDNALEQPQVIVHRDYHSRNLMMDGDNGISIIDFQDAVLGPITYDIVSLLRDCYQKLPAECVDHLFDYFIENIHNRPELSEKIKGVSKKQLIRWFDLMGIQRHIKASGIFARLPHRDNKPTYIDDIPLTLQYIIQVTSKYPELSFLNKLVTEKVLPAIINSLTISNNSALNKVKT